MKIKRRFCFKRLLQKLFIPAIVASAIYFFGSPYWGGFLAWVVGIFKIIKEKVPMPVWNFIITFIITALLTYLVEIIVRRRHFHSLPMVRDILRAMRNRVRLSNSYSREENKIVDSFVQSPIEYVNEIVEGNQVPKFDPDDTYMDVLYDDKIKFIVAITAENPNLFLDPTIGFYMSNCYAASLIRHTNDFIKRTKSKPNSIPQLCMKDLEELEKKIKCKRKNIIDELKSSGKLNDFEFIRIFMYDEQQSEIYDNAVFPSLKASQDLFRTLSFYLQKEKLIGNLNKKGKWEGFREINEKLWGLFDRTCKCNPRAREVRKKRIDNVVPEFLFVFYEEKIGIHTYLGGEYCKRRVDLNSNAGENIFELVKLLASYVDEDGDNGQLLLGEKQNEHNTYIDWEWV